MVFERRNHPRCPVTLEFVCASGQRTLGLSSRDLGRGGVFLYTHAPEPVGTQVNLVVRIPRGPVITITGEVVHSVCDVGMGIRFLSFSNGGPFLLRQYLRSLAQHGDCEGAEPEAVHVDPRRLAPRVDFEAIVTLWCGGFRFTGRALDISAGGMFIAADYLVPAGTEATLEFALPDAGGPVRTRAQVRWVRMLGATDDAPVGMGLCFLDMAVADRQRIDDLVAQRDSGETPDETSRMLALMAAVDDDDRDLVAGDYPNGDRLVD